MENDEEDPLYEFSEDDVVTVLSSFAEEIEFLSMIDIEDICNAYIKMYPAIDKKLMISRARLDALIEHFVNKGLMQLVNEGLVELSIGEGGEFFFKKI